MTRARVAVSGAFAAQGFAFALVITGLAGFKEKFGLDDLAVTAVTLGVCVAAALGTGVADRLARAAGGSRLALVLGLLVVAGATVVITLAGSTAVLVAGFVVYGVGLGLVDAGTNMQAVAIQQAYGRSLMTGFYACWSAAGILGAVLTSVGAGTGSITALRLASVPVVLLAAVAVHRAGVVRSAPVTSADGRATGVAIPWAVVIVLGLGVVAFYVADTAVSTWSTIYLGDVLLATAVVAPLGYAAYLGTTLASRLAGDHAVRRWGRTLVVRTAALVAGAGLLAVVLAPGVPVGLLGFAVAGAGLGLIAPLCFSAAGALAPGREDAVIARLNVFNYVGAVLGGVLVGAIGSASTLRIAFVVPLVLILGVAVIAGRFERHDGSHRGAEPAATALATVPDADAGGPVAPSAAPAAPAPAAHAPVDGPGSS